MKDYNKVLENYRKALLNENFITKDVAKVLYTVPNNDIVKVGRSTVCHASMSTVGSSRATTVGHFMCQNTTKETNEFIEWLGSPKSAYKGIIDYLGKDFHIIRNDKGFVAGHVVMTNKISNKILTNFFKAARTINEHKRMLPFWTKWKHKDPALAFVLAYFIDEKGQKRSTTHGVLDSPIHQNFALHRIANLDHGEWKLNSSTIAEGSDYYGETAATWKGKVDIYNTIPDLGSLEVPTHFWYKYHGKNLKRYDDETLEYFFDHYKELINGN